MSYVSVGDLDVPGDKITVEATFMRTAPYSGGQVWAGDLVSKHNNPPDANYLLRPNNAEITTTNGYFRTPDICEIELNKIYHAAFVYDGVTLKFYRNGFLMSSVPCTGNMFQNNFQTRIGLYDALVHNTQLIGYINEVRIWNVARSQTQIRAYMNSSLPSPPNQNGLLAYYTFDNLLNKQGNTLWNGIIGGPAILNATIPGCTYVADSCKLNPPPVVAPDFEIPDTVCVNTPVNITNISTAATSYYWNFCVANINQAPVATNIGNPGGLLSQPVFMDYVFYNNNYYGFSINHFPGKLVRLDFGNSLLNTPTAVDLGNFGGIIPPGYGAEGIQIIQNEGKWYAIVVGGYTPSGSTPRILKIEFGANLLNASPVATDWGNIGNMSQPLDLHVFQENNQWYGLTINAENNTVTRFNFSNSFNNVPTGVNLGNFGLLDYPTGIYAINDNGFWRVFVTNHGGPSKLVRLDFGSSLLNAPTAVSLGSVGSNVGMRDITIIKYCEEVTGFAVNAVSNTLFKLDFATLSSVPVVTDLGNIGSLSTPHSISRLFRVGQDLYTFITNVGTNTVTRLKFSGCNNSSIPNSTLKDPLPVSYNAPGTYNINLTIDDGLPTQNSICKKVVVVDLAKPPTKLLSFCQGDSARIGPSVKFGNYQWNNGAITDSITIKQAGIYWVQSSKFGCVSRDSFIVTIKPQPVVFAGNDTIVCKVINLPLNANSPGSTFQWSTGSQTSTAVVQSAGTYYVTVMQAGCRATDTVKVSLFPKPIINTSNDTTVCKQASVPLFVSGGSTYTWSPSATLTSPSIYNPVATVNTDTRYFVVVKDANGCEHQDSVQVNIFKVPAANVPPGAAICQGATFQLSAQNGTAYNWSPAATLNDPAASNPIASPINSTVYQLLLTYGNNCKVQDSVKVTILPLPVPVVSNDTTVCRNSSLQLFAAGGTSYSWTSAGPIVNAGTSSPLVNPNVDTRYYVTVTDANNCKKTDSVNVSVYQLPVPSVTNDTTVCNNTPLQLFASGGSSYVWSPASTLNNPGIANPIATPTSNVKYYVTVTDNHQCAAIDSVNIILKPKPVFAVNSPGEICLNGSSQLSASGGNVYSWQPAIGLSNPSISNPVASPLTATDYAVTITELTCQETVTLFTRLDIAPLPTIKATRSTDLDCSNDRSQLIATGGVSYLWSPSTTLDASSSSHPIAQPTATTVYVVTGKDNKGCENRDSVIVKVEATNAGNYLMPTAFSPNNDNLNDCYGVKYWGVILELEFSVFNRWGERLFFTKNPTDCWNGIYKGKAQDAGVYVYMIKAKTICEKEVFRKGTFVLVK